ncbi:ABC transporter permease [Alkalispirochaeta sphaeroplastigenens]|uniref:ABC transporter permease n=1 Tax=Alkalispirochaeta sphaeroplastigenens TaxID=1187066 RepID=A0A2S4JFS3_9SPIO|nr:sugar ABC transporter permease [Alkalispirochaeta sphaeroplastigenens]POQ98391.1 ABC transporter permease [Alkalispirochaeta sphaeroplastigenens]
MKTRLRLSSDDVMARVVLFPAIIITLVFVYGFILFTVYLSFTGSRILPIHSWVGFENYRRLFRLDHWYVALRNMGIFFVLYIGISTLVGLLLAVLIDLHRFGERFFRPIFLYPMAISFIVTGTAWKWFLDPGIGLQHIMRTWGFTAFTFDWIKNSEMAIYTVVIAAVWQVSGFVMVIFLSGLRAIDHGTVESAVVDGAGFFNLYTRVIIPQLAGSFLSVFVILGHMAIKSYDLVIALTGGGPGRATALPSTFMYSYTFQRNQMGIGAASAVIMLLGIAAIIVPYIRSQVKEL